MKPEYAKALPEDWTRFSRFFFAMGERTRQQILLLFDAGEEICVSDIARLFDLSRPAISHHLKVMREAGLLLSEKRGKEVYYRVNHVYCADVLRLVHEFVLERGGSRAARPPRLPAEVSGLASWDRMEGSVPAANIRTPKSDD